MLLTTFLFRVRTEFFSTIGFPLLKKSLDKFKSEFPNHAIDASGVLINNSESTESPRGPHHSDALRDIHEQAKIYQWPAMQNQMFLSRGHPKLMREIPNSHWKRGPRVPKNLGRIYGDDGTLAARKMTMQKNTLDKIPISSY